MDRRRICAGDRMATAGAGIAPMEYPKINFSGVDGRWGAVRAEVMAALATHGFFEVVYPAVSQSVRDALFGQAAKDLFALPLDAKLRNHSDKPYKGYIGQIPHLAYESLAIFDAQLPQGAEAFTRLMWPEGNPRFSETMQAFTKQLADLIETVRRMVLESLGVEKYHKELVDSSRYLLRLSEYGGASPVAQKKHDGEELVLGAHRDNNTLTVVCQNGVDGLEMETKYGEWIAVTPSPDSFVVISGDSMRAWSNGRLYSPSHRVVLPHREGEAAAAKRYSAIFFSIPMDDTVICAPPELTDHEHPPLFKPYDYGSYMRFSATAEGMKASNKLDTYCGLGGR